MLIREPDFDTGSEAEEVLTMGADPRTNSIAEKMSTREADLGSVRRAEEAARGKCTVKVI